MLCGTLCVVCKQIVIKLSLSHSLLPHTQHTHTHTTDWRPGRTIILCSWDAEEYGLMGATEWVEVSIIVFPSEVRKRFLQCSNILTIIHILHITHLHTYTHPHTPVLFSDLGIYSQWMKWPTTAKKPSHTHTPHSLHSHILTIKSCTSDA